MKPTIHETDMKPTTDNVICHTMTETIGLHASPCARVTKGVIRAEARYRPRHARFTDPVGHL